MTDRRPTLWLQLKILLRDVHPAVWRRVGLADSLSIADLHRVIQLLMGWDDDHLHRFRIHGRDYGIAYLGGPSFGEDAASVPLSRFGFCPSERFLYEYQLHGWLADRGAGRAGDPGGSREPLHSRLHRRPPARSPDGCGGPFVYAERRRDALGWAMADDMDAVVAILRRVSDGDPTVLDDPDERADFERAVSRLKARTPFLVEEFPLAQVNVALRQAFTAARDCS